MSPLKIPPLPISLYIGNSQLYRTNHTQIRLLPQLRALKSSPKKALSIRSTGYQIETSKKDGSRPYMAADGVVTRTVDQYSSP